MPKVSQDHIDERRDFILEAAARCFAREGFHATSVADVIEESGLSAGSVYRYFKNKDDLIGAIVEHYLSATLTEIQNVVEKATDPTEAVISAIKLLSTRIKGPEDAPFTRLLPQIWAEAMRNEQIRVRGQSIYQSVLVTFEDVIRKAQAQGTLSADVHPKGASNVMLALVQGYILQTMLLPGDVNASQYTKTVRQLFSKT